MRPFPPRHDLYAGIHKAMRAWMQQVLAEFGRLDCSDAEDMAHTLRAVRELLTACRQHLEHENVFIHPAMETRRPGSTAHVEEDHEAHERAIAALEAELQGLAGALPPTRPACAHALYLQLASFVAENFEHMAREETRHNTVLWACYSDSELQAIEQALVASIAPEDMDRCLRWMVPALNPQERGELFAGLRAALPPAVFARLLDQLEALLQPLERVKLRRALAIAC
ncbi:hemerythrin domain-containing protein [Plasticicumulans acidivorans]|uniref:Hemerythrin HHE cation binding domain-containing protein n=1 Tax=Plasticicumulans acidivorans TaxID=886464 RepID=A0A317MUZ1_9GAMM|nr:hemerythrin domain-containing protein [Plasticicumulans acidivorans]PWV61123.1 hemerythrin HHE cation binding domain-containing protein [Plasticicumulans acidivorans]